MFILPKTYHALIYNEILVHILAHMELARYSVIIEIEVYNFWSMGFSFDWLSS